METLNGTFKMKDDIEVQDSAFKDIKWVSVLESDGSNVQLSIRKDNESPRTVTIGIDYFHGLFEKVTHQ